MILWRLHSGKYMITTDSKREVATITVTVKHKVSLVQRFNVEQGASMKAHTHVSVSDEDKRDIDDATKIIVTKKLDNIRYYFSVLEGGAM